MHFLKIILEALLNIAVGLIILGIGITILTVLAGVIVFIATHPYAAFTYVCVCFLFLIYCVIAWTGAFFVVRKHPFKGDSIFHNDGTEPGNMVASALFFLTGPIWYWLYLIARVVIKIGELVTGLKVDW